MKPTFTVAACATFLGLLALAQSATAEPKTASQCNADWAANKASIQASGQTRRAFVAGPRRSDRGASTRGAGQKPVRDRSRGESELFERCGGVGQFRIHGLPSEWQP
jgi:hypothetical protein